MRRALPVYLALLVALLTAVSILLLYVALRHVLLILFVSVLFAAALSGPSEWLHDRLRLPRGIAAVLIYVVAFAVLVGVAWLVVPPLLGQVAEFADRAPQYADRYEGVRKAYGELRKDYPALPPFDDQMSRLGNAILDRAGERAASLPADLFSLFLDLLSVFVISLLLVTNRMRLRGFTLSLVGHGHRERVAEVLDRSWSRIGVYLRAKVIVMAIVGALTYVALLVIGVPFAVPLAIIVAFGELIPRAGPWLARIPLLSIAALEGPRTFVLTLIASIVIENLKGLPHLAVRRGRPARHPSARRVRRRAGRRDARRARGRVRRGAGGGDRGHRRPRGPRPGGRSRSRTRTAGPSFRSPARGPGRPFARSAGA